MEFADGSKKVISVMGGCGMHKALALYPDLGSYHMMNTIDENDFLGLREIFLSVPQLQLAFEPAKNLQNGERDFLKQSNLKFPRGANPSFVSYAPGAMPARVGGGELAVMTRFLGAFRDFCRTGRLAELSVHSGKNGLVSTWREKSAGYWTFEEDEFSRLFPVMATLSAPAFYEKLKTLPAKKGLHLEVGTVSLPVGKSSWRQSVVRLALVVEKESQFILGCEIVEPENGCETDWGVVVDTLLTIIARGGIRPERLSAFGKCVSTVLAGLCSNELSDMRFDPLDPCTSFRDAASRVLQQFGAI